FELMARRGLLDAGVVDQHVQGAECPQNLLKHGFHLRFVGNVRLDRQFPALIARATGFVGHLASDLRLVRSAPLVNRDVRAFTREANRDRLPDPGRSPGDQYVLSLEFRHSISLLCAKLKCASSWKLFPE